MNAVTPRRAGGAGQVEVLLLKPSQHDPGRAYVDVRIRDANLRNGIAIRRQNGGIEIFGPRILGRDGIADFGRAWSLEPRLRAEVERAIAQLWKRADATGAGGKPGVGD